MDLREQLQSAVGSSEFVIAIFIDVRNFTSFAGTNESINAAIFLKRIYIKILDDYFPDISFCKLTGDGMMIIRSYDENSLEEIVNDSISKSIELVKNFPNFCDEDKMINFEVPQKIGIGIARASATKLSSADVTLDYSGRPLNLAARLMDLARPNGLVFGSQSVGLDVVKPDLLTQFSEDQVYIKGIAQDSKIDIHYLSGFVDIDPSSYLPINRFMEKSTEPITWKFDEAKELSNRFVIKLPEKPEIPNSCRVHVRHQKIKPDGTENPMVMSFFDLPAEYTQSLDGPGARFSMDEVRSRLVQDGLTDTSSFTVQISYQMRFREDDQA